MDNKHYLMRNCTIGRCLELAMRQGFDIERYFEQRDEIRIPHREEDGILLIITEHGVNNYDVHVENDDSRQLLNTKETFR